MPLLVYDLQGAVDILEFRGQNAKVSADIRSYFLAAVNTFVFLDMGGNFLGNGIVVPEDVAKNSFHNVGFRYALVDLGLPMVVLNLEFLW